ncbi:hypothetical protein C8E97_4908 [Saccharothrix australiensis]|uniref:Uncharacterized protein n=1 Tax=Saccharothrix australiensis TaxID=2072 RepID=A0A495W3Z4_9PSEU|nr:hypothetical protein C8E97_4908 [Saccharothrix australiensis]
MVPPGWRGRARGRRAAPGPPGGPCGRGHDRTGRRCGTVSRRDRRGVGARRPPPPLTRRCPGPEQARRREGRRRSRQAHQEDDQRAGTARAARPRGAGGNRAAHGSRAGRDRLGQACLADQVGALQQGHVLEHDLVAHLGEPADGLVARGRADRADDREDRAARRARAVGERVVERRAGARPHLGHPRPLVGVGLVGQRHAEPRGRPHHAFVQEAVVAGRPRADVPHAPTGRAGLRLLAHRHLPQAREPHLDQEVPVRRGDRAERGLLDRARVDGVVGAGRWRGEGGEREQQHRHQRGDAPEALGRHGKAPQEPDPVAAPASAWAFRPSGVTANQVPPLP